MALTTRPSQACDGRTAARTADTTARQPRRTPSSGANGISSALPPEKPTTSQGIGLALAGLDDDAGADRHGVQRPGHLDHQAAHADHPAVNLDSVQFLDLLEQSPHRRGLRR